MATAQFGSTIFKNNIYKNSYIYLKQFLLNNFLSQAFFCKKKNIYIYISITIIIVTFTIFNYNLTITFVLCFLLSLNYLKEDKKIIIGDNLITTLIFLSRFITIKLLLIQ